MGYQVAISPSARRDLRDIVRYISLDSPERSVTFGQFLVNNTKRLADFPSMLLAMEMMIPEAQREEMLRRLQAGESAYDVAYRLRMPEILVKFSHDSSYNEFWKLFKNW